MANAPTLNEIRDLFRSWRIGPQQLPLCKSGVAQANTVVLGNDPRLAGGGGGMADPGSNGLVYRTALNVTAIATMLQILQGLGNPAANLILAGPVSGGAATATFRSLVLADVPWPVTTKGDLLAYSTTQIRFPVGSNGQIIVADSTQAAGLKWASPSGIIIGVSAGKDRNRPAAASTTNTYAGTDTNQNYFSDQTVWRSYSCGPDKVTLENLAGGFSDTNYLVSGVGLNAGPTMALNTSFAIGFHVISLPGVGGTVMFNYMNGAVVDGFFLANSTVNANKFRVIMRNVNASGSIELPGTSAITTGFHVLAMNYDGAQIRYCLDGGSVSTVATTGTYLPPTAAAAVFVGRYAGGTTFSTPWMQFGFYQHYASFLVDADLQTLGTNLANYQPGNITTDPALDWQARWVNVFGNAGNTASFPAYGTAANKLASLGAAGTTGIFKVIH